MDSPFVALMGRAEDKRRNKLAREMSHELFKDPYEGVSEAFATGIYRAPGQMAGLFDLAAKAAPMYHALQYLSPTETTLKSTVDQLVGLGDVEKAYVDLEPSTGWGASENLQALASMAGEVVGEEGLTLGGLAAVKGLTKTPQAMTRLLDEIMHESVIRDQIGAIGSIGAKTADLRALETAKAMKANGVDADEIFTKTGWWLDHPDGKPRFEIDDSAAAFSPVHEGTIRPLDKAMTHDELLAAYPDLSRVSVKADNLGTTAGRYGGVNEFTGSERIDVNPRYKDTDSTTLHELQHAIQQREGMARGGSPDMFNFDPRVTRELQDRHDLYRRLAGEAEARLVQDRMNMTAAERAANPFYKGFDVPLADQIVRMDGGVAQSLPTDEASRNILAGGAAGAVGLGLLPQEDR